MGVVLRRGSPRGESCRFRFPFPVHFAEGLLRFRILKTRNFGRIRFLFWLYIEAEGVHDAFVFGLIQ